jgi:ABC-2 type transport system ATP-binding protein
MALLEVKQVSKNYGSTQALRNVSFEVAPGEIFGLLGANGAGKTTLLSILACLLDPDAGEVRLLGQTLRSNDRAVRHLIGLVPQELAIYDELTARENLAFFGELYGLSGKALARQVDQILDATALTDRANDRARTFSGGMKRRLNLGVALVHQPRLLLLDEPTVGIDPQSRNHIFEEVRRLNAAGLTIIYTSHYMEEVQALCSRIGIMDHGEVRACDTLQNLLNKVDGVIRLGIPNLTPAIQQRLEMLPETHLKITRLASWEGEQIELRCRDVKTTLVRLITSLNEAGVELSHLETEEPSLERVFLDLTGRALRD